MIWVIFFNGFHDHIRIFEIGVHDFENSETILIVYIFKNIITLIKMNVFHHKYNHHMLKNNRIH